MGDRDGEGIEADDRGHGDAHDNAREPAEDDVALIARDTLCSNPWGLYPTRAQLRHLSRYVGADGPCLEPPDAEWLVSERSIRRNGDAPIWPGPWVSPDMPDLRSAPTCPTFGQPEIRDRIRSNTRVASPMRMRAI